MTLRCRVYISYDGNPTVGAVTTTEITSKVQSVSIRRGRSHELEEFQAGTATIVLDNRDGSFDPASMNLRVPVWINADTGSGTYPRFAGYVQSWDASFPQHGRNATVTIQAADYFAVLARRQIPATAYEYAVRRLSPDAWWRLADDDATMRDELGNSNYDGAYTGNRVRADALEVGGNGASAVATIGKPIAYIKSTTSSTALFPASSQFTIAGIVRVYSFIADAPFVHFTNLAGAFPALQIGVSKGLLFGQAIDGGLNIISTTNGPSVADGATHHVALVRDGKTIYLYIDGVLNQSATNASFSTGTLTYTNADIGFGNYGAGVLDELAVWTSALSSNDILGLAYASRGFAGQDVGYHLSTLIGGVFSASSVTLGAWEGDTDALSYCQRAVRSDQGRFFVDHSGTPTFVSKTGFQTAGSVCVFDDSGVSAVPYDGLGSSKDDRLVFNEITVTGSSGATATVRDATSINAYGPLSLSWQTLLPSDNACRDVAEALLARFKDPSARPKMWSTYPTRTLIGSASSSASYTFNVELGNKVVLGRSGVQTTVEVTSIVDDIDMPKGLWRVSFTGAPTVTTTWFRWGTSNWDGSDDWS